MSKTAPQHRPTQFSLFDAAVTEPAPAPFRTKQSSTPSATSASVIQVETNFLRFPLFALDNKNLDKFGIRISGTRRIGESRHDFSLEITRNSTYNYPGLLARNIHHALLRLIKQHGFPFQNPVNFTWRQLCREMGIPPSGRTVQKLKYAIACTKGLMIASDHALVDGRTGEPLGTRRRLFQLYDDVVFTNEVRDGKQYDQNVIWLADWYVANLNSFYSAPLSADLWKSLNAESPIASRLYEYFTFMFHAGKTVRINYSRLCDFIPVRPRRHLSLARQQLRRPLSLLHRAGIVSSTNWTVSKDGQIQLVFTAGDDLPATRERREQEDDVIEEYTIREIPQSESPARGLVAEFHRLWSGTGNCVPIKSELRRVEEFFERFGEDWVIETLPTVVKVMKDPTGGFPHAKTFGASKVYFEAEWDRQQKKKLRKALAAEEQARLAAERDRAERASGEEHARQQELLLVWSTYSSTKQAALLEKLVQAETSPFARTQIQKDVKDLHAGKPLQKCVWLRGRVFEKLESIENNAA